MTTNSAADLIAFLNARLDEDAAEARFVHVIDCSQAFVSPEHCECDCGYPARVLREVEAKRKILAEHEAVTRLAGLTEQELGFLGWYREWVLKNLAAVWSGHTDYRQEWKG